MTHVRLEVVPFTVRVTDVVWRRVQRAQSTSRNADERISPSAVSGKLPEHGSGKAVVVDVLRLDPDDVGGVVGDEFLLG